MIMLYSLLVTSAEYINVIYIYASSWNIQTLEHFVHVESTISPVFLFYEIFFFFCIFSVLYSKMLTERCVSPLKEEQAN